MANLGNNSPNSVQDPAVFVKDRDVPVLVWDVPVSDLVYFGRPRHGFHYQVHIGRKSRTRRRKKKRKSRRKSKVKRKSRVKKVKRKNKKTKHK